MAMVCESRVDWRSIGDKVGVEFDRRAKRTETSIRPSVRANEIERPQLQ